VLRILLGALELGVIIAFTTAAVALVRQSIELRRLLQALRAAEEEERRRLAGGEEQLLE
jgi:hypothetical protein